MKSVSVALAVHNGAQYIGEQLKSLANQIHLPCELIVSDNASTDDTLSIIDAFAAKSPFPVSIHKNQENMGFRANFMKAASLCKGELISFCDCDDIWFPQKLKKCAAAFEDKNVLLVFHNAIVADENMLPLGHYTGDRGMPGRINPPHTIRPFYFGLGFTQVFDRRLIALDPLWAQSISPSYPNEQEAHDQWYFFIAACLGTIIYIDESLALYRQHARNAFGWTRPQFVFDNLKKLAIRNIDDIAIREKSAAYRAKVMGEAQKQFDGDFSDRAVQGMADYQKLERMMRQRRQIYEFNDVLGRLQQIKSMLSSGLYEEDEHWGFTKRTLFRDVVRGVILPLKVRSSP